MKTKKCSKCGECKHLSEFRENKRYISGYEYNCRKCISKYNSEYREKHPEVKWNEYIRNKETYRKSMDRYRKFNLKKVNDAKKKWRSNNIDKQKAHAVINRLNIKKAIKYLPCEMCGSLKTVAHHDDYSKPIEIRFLCRKHHAEHHRKK